MQWLKILIVIRDSLISESSVCETSCVLFHCLKEKNASQAAITCSKLTIELLEQGVKSVQSQE